MKRMSGVVFGALLIIGCAGIATSPTPGHPTPTGVPTPTSPPTAAVELSGAEFTRSGGCGDALLWATNEANTLGVLIHWPGAATASQVDDGYQEAVELPDNEVTVTLQVGQAISEGYCTDILMPDRPRIDAESIASAGLVEIRATAGGGDRIFPLATATLVLDEVTFEIQAVEGPETWRLVRLELHDIQVGWMPG